MKEKKKIYVHLLSKYGEAVAKNEPTDFLVMDLDSVRRDIVNSLEKLGISKTEIEYYLLNFK